MGRGATRSKLKLRMSLSPSRGGGELALALEQGTQVSGSRCGGGQVVERVFGSVDKLRLAGEVDLGGRGKQRNTGVHGTVLATGGVVEEDLVFPHPLLREVGLDGALVAGFEIANDDRQTTDLGAVRPAKGWDVIGGSRGGRGAAEDRAVAVEAEHRQPTRRGGHKQIDANKDAVIAHLLRGQGCGADAAGAERGSEQSTQVGAGHPAQRGKGRPWRRVLCCCRSVAEAMNPLSGRSPRG